MPATITADVTFDTGLSLQLAIDSVQKDDGQNVALTKQVDASSPRLFQALANVMLIKTVVITVRPAKFGARVETTTLNDVIVTNLTRSPDGSEVVLMNYGAGGNRVLQDLPAIGNKAAPRLFLKQPFRKF